MKIVEIENLSEATDPGVYYEFEGKFFGLCGHCGSPVEVDYHRTRYDLRHDETGEEMYFCNKSCEDSWLSTQNY